MHKPHFQPVIAKTYLIEDVNALLRARGEEDLKHPERIGRDDLASIRRALEKPVAEGGVATEAESRSIRVPSAAGPATI